MTARAGGVQAWRTVGDGRDVPTRLDCGESGAQLPNTRSPTSREKAGLGVSLPVLSYFRSSDGCPRQDSNLRPSAPETGQTRFWQVIGVHRSAAVGPWIVAL